jgi:uncharacterized protein (DUF2141 family)
VIAIASVIAIAVAIAMFSSVAMAQSPGAGALPGGNVIRVHYVGMPDDVGRAGCAIWSSATGWPRQREQATQRVGAPIKNGSAVCEFWVLPPGTYAVATFHDKQMTGKMALNFLGMPTESYGFSNDAPVGLGPPSFDAASFKYPGGVFDITIHAKK